MYLEFIKDIFQINDCICIECGKEHHVGHLLKISNELIAIKTKNGIIIKKDQDITDVYSYAEEKTSLDSINEGNIVQKQTEDTTNATKEVQNVIENTIEETNSVDPESQEQHCKSSDSEASEENNNDLSSSDGVTIVEANIQSDSETDEASEVKEQEASKTQIFETAKPQLKIVGYVDLSKIKDKKKKKISIEQNSKPDDSKEKKIEAEKKSDSPKLEQSFAKTERYINTLIQTGKTREALYTIDQYLKSDSCIGKLRSSLLLKKAQTYSALSEYELAKKAYEELIQYNESIKSPNNNLSHLYTELARLQNLTNEGKTAVLGTLKKALKYNPNNTYASTLYEQLSSDRYVPVDANDSEDEQFKLELEEMSTTISQMINIDIKEHTFSHESIIKNGGTPTPNIAKAIYEEAKRTKDVDLSERYPVYLEAAKAYSVLPIGSYDTQEYLESVAFYAILKGNSLFVRFKKLLFESNPDIELLTHIKDSACSYYIESLNLLSNIEGEHLLLILANYLKMNIALVCIAKGEEPSISGQFDKVFFNCVRSSDSNLNLIAWSTIVAVGTASPKAWNKLTGIEGGTSGLYGVMNSSEKRQSIYSVINRINGDHVNTELLPSDFLKTSFANRKKRNKQFKDVLSKILKAEFNVRLLSSLDELWREISDYLDLLSETDKESQLLGDKVLRNLLPYSTRQNQIERTNLLYQAQASLEEQIAFINQNTTYYGRTFFFPLFTKWRAIIQQILKDKISQTLPLLQVVPDPSFLVKDGDKLVVNLIVKNVGESTAEGYRMNATLKSLERDIEISGVSKDEKEIAVGNHFDKRMTLPDQFSGCKSIDISIDVSSIYQGELTASHNYRYTLELEPENALSEEDIIWKDGPKMSGVLFKGRQEIMDKLIRHYLSVERDKPYILYGLTRTGKSSILLNLKKAISGKTFLKDGTRYEVVPFEWDLSLASGLGNAKDMWQYLLRDTLYDEFDQYLDSSYEHDLAISEYPRAKDFKSILQYLKTQNKYPMFFIDEFSHIKVLLDSHIINTSFLHTLRQYSLEGLASFIYAGTYDIKELIRDPKYAITGQLVHTVEEQINEIDAKSAEELVNVMKDKLTFTEEAIKHIHLLSGDVPYFIQIICKFCGYYAVEKKRSYIGKPELENVIKILTGEMPGETDSMIKVLPKSIFQNNLYSPQDKNEVNVLISSLCYINGDLEIPRGVSIPELQELWSKNGIEAFRAKLAEAITLLLERKVLTQSKDELIPVYKISVDMFRRWWKVHYPDIKLEITSIQ